MEHIQDGKSTEMRIEENLKEIKRSEDEYNRETLGLNKAILYITCLIFILTGILVYLAIVP